MVNNLLEINKELDIERIQYKIEIDEFLDNASHPDLNKIEIMSQEAFNKNEIPKIIHFCFVNYKDVPSVYYLFFKCWKDVLGENYTFINWTPEILPENDFSSMCLRDHSWAFFADYARTYAVYTYGGFYLDADIWVYKSFDDLLHSPYVFDIEHSCLSTMDRRPRLEAGVFGSRRYNNLIKELLEFYQSIRSKPLFDYGSIIAPFLWNDISQRKGFTLLYNYGDMDDFEKFLLLNDDEKTVCALNGEYFSKTETDLPNRFLLGERSGIKEQHHMDCAYTSHQFLSNWC